MSGFNTISGSKFRRHVERSRSLRSSFQGPTNRQTGGSRSPRTSSSLRSSANGTSRRSSNWSEPSNGKDPWKAQPYPVQITVIYQGQTRTCRFLSRSVRLERDRDCHRKNLAIHVNDGPWRPTTTRSRRSRRVKFASQLHQSSSSSHGRSARFASATGRAERVSYNSLPNHVSHSSGGSRRRGQ